MTDRLIDIPANKLKPSPYNPRTQYDQKVVAELAQSIKENGLSEPLLVRPLPNRSFEIVSGHTRLRACQLLELDAIPCRVSQMTDSDARRHALISNISRTDMNPVDVANGLRAWMDQEGLTQRQLATAVGKGPSEISEILSVLKAEPRIQQLAAEGKLSLGHVKRLSRVSDPTKQAKLAAEAVEKGFTVRDLERLIAQLKNGNVAPPSKVRRAHWSEKVNLARKTIQKACDTLEAANLPEQRQARVKSAVRFLRLAEEQLN